MEQTIHPDWPAQRAYPRPDRRLRVEGPLVKVRSITFARLRSLSAVVTTPAWTPLQEAPWLITGPVVVLLSGRYLPVAPITVLAPDQAHHLADSLVEAGTVLDSEERDQSWSIADTCQVSLKVTQAHYHDWCGDWCVISDQAWPSIDNETGLPTDRPGQAQLYLTRAELDPVAAALRRVARSLRSV